jgi:uncharacterized protein
MNTTDILASVKHNVLPLIDKYYGENRELRALLLLHSESVARKALECAKIPLARGESVDMSFVAEAAMLHDIGVVRCDAPDIYCYGTEPYICHGVIGGEILRQEGLPRHASVSERHTGAGLTVEDIQRQSLPLPHKDMTPQSVEERLICYADKFFSKSGDAAMEKPFDRVCLSMQRHGEDTLHRFLLLHAEFSDSAIIG